MGHASVQITLDRYSNLMKDSHPAQAARLSSLVFDTAPSANGAPADTPKHRGTPGNVKGGNQL